MVPRSFRPVSVRKDNLDGASESDLEEIYLKPITSVAGAANVAPGTDVMGFR